ncbi:MAG TPA: hypothetical protein PKD17_18060 [Cellvibrionaceae bacterium]|nr:hypothetical protein [Cellvibrionaceae bacterium]HMW73736.1 hypothetical protein [Cellvibrionaceae bacterium]HMY41313.1 hypothetical protein [Marinagarivorans sp.]HNG58464.1 hypothetical protein [Cellvibrionaceae bacterium]
MNLWRHIILGVVSFSLSLSACSNPPAKSVEGFVVDGVNEYAFDFAEQQPGAMISFHSKDFQKCTLSFAAKDFGEKFKASAQRLGEGNLDILCVNDEGNFILSPSEPTSVAMEVMAVRPAVQVRVDFNLYNPRKKTWRKAEDIILNLSASQSKRLANNK